MLKRKSSFVPRVTLFLMSLLFSLLLGEIYLRVFDPQIFEAYPPGLYESDSQVGYVLTPGFTGVLARSEFETRVSIGPTGLRGTEFRPRKCNTFRILTVGDSLTFGFGVNYDETYSARLEAKLEAHYPDRDIQVLNCGVPGYGTADQMAFLRAKGSAYEPDLIIVQFLSVNDLEENRSPASQWALVKDGKLGTLLSDDQPPSWQTIQRWAKQNSHLARLTSDSLGYWGTRFGILNEVAVLWGEDFSLEDAQTGSRLLAGIADWSFKRGAKTLFLYTTGQSFVIQEAYTQPRSAKVVADAARETGTPWIDIAFHMQRHPNRQDFYYPKDGHWTSAGHEVVAEIVLEAIIRQSLI